MADQSPPTPDDPTGPGPGDSTRVNPPGPAGLPARIGSYHIRRLIGSGGMGAVYEAMQEQPRRIVALKVMRQGVASPSSLRRFEYESQVLARLHHPCIAQIFEAGTHRDPTCADPVPYFAMEYIALATPITDYARDRGLSSRQRLGLMSRICDAVAHGHSKGIVHRDLKPSNIMIDAEGNPKVIDFGVARGTDSDLALTTLQTGAGQIIGTLQYMSPEQCSADPRALDHRSDIYSLGIVLFELLCDRLPYDVASASLGEATRIIREAPTPRPSTVNRTVRGDLETIILRAVEKDRDRRYQSAADLRDDIDRFLAGDPIFAKRDSLAYVARARVRAWAGRNRAGAILLIIIAAAVVAQPLGTAAFFKATGANRAYEAWCTTLLPRGIDEFRHVRMIALTDATDIAALSGVPAPQEGQPNLRPLHAKLLERLAPAHPAVVMFDSRFIASTPFDGQWAASARALAAAGTDAVVGYPGVEFSADGLPQLSPEIARAARWGSLAGVANGSAPWRLFLAVKRGDEEPRMSIALRALLSASHPGMDAWVELDAGAEEVRLRAKRPSSTLPGAGEYVGLPIVIPLSVRTWDERPIAGIRQGDLVAAYQVDPPPTEVFERATTPYPEALSAEPARLQSLFAGKIVVVYDGRAGVDRVGHPSGRTLPGAYAHAAGLEQLVRGDAVRTPGVTLTWVLTLAASAAGGLALAIGRRGVMRWANPLVVLALILPLCLAAYSISHLLISPFVPALAMILAAALCAALPPARHNARGAR